MTKGLQIGPVGRERLALVAGDLSVYLVSTLAGFATHGELVPEAWVRFLGTFLSFGAAWFLLALPLRLYDLEQARDRRRLWRPFLAAVYSAPLGGWLRGLWLGSAVLPMFVLTMAAVTGGLMLLWRGLYFWCARRRPEASGPIR